MPLRKIVGSSQLYRGLPASTLDGLLVGARLHRVSRGERVVRMGASVPGVFVVGSGMFRLERSAKNGRLHVVDFVEAGKSFGESPVIARYPSPVDGIAEEASEHVVLRPEAVREAAERDPRFCLRLLRATAMRLERAALQIDAVALHAAPSRVARYLLSRRSDSEGWIELRVFKADLARHLGVTSETLSRTLRRFREAGIVQVDRRRVRLLDVARLAAAIDA